MPKLRFTLNWIGFPGAPGYSHFIVGDEAGSETEQVAAIRTLVTSWLPQLPNDVQLALEPTAQQLDDSTGNQIGASTFDPGAAQIGGSASAWSAATGLVLIWHTGTFRNNREIRGRTFLVPAGSNAFGSDSGAPLTTVITALGAAAQAFTIGVPGMAFVETSQTGANRFVPLVGGTLSPRAAVLRSRRD